MIFFTLGNAKHATTNQITDKHVCNFRRIKWRKMKYRRKYMKKNEIANQKNPKSHGYYHGPKKLSKR